MAEAGSPRTFVFVLVDGSSMMSLASAVEPLRSANRLGQREFYRWHLASLEGGPVRVSNGFEFATEPLETLLPSAQYLFVCGGLRIRAPNERRYFALLRQAARRGVVIGSLSTGTDLLARAGLLGGYRCTIHWENRPAFEEQFPDLTCTGKIYEVDRDRMTCSGGTAAMDLMLHLIADQHGFDLAHAVANQFHHERIRDEREEQRGGRDQSFANLPKSLRKAEELMRHHIEEPLSVEQIAERISLTSRQVERLFLRYLSTTPGRHYLNLRLDRARELLLYSDMPVFEVAFATGFASTSHFASWFRRVYNLRPSDLRKPAKSMSVS
jgi:transcriptional regulator GlxA family with amidase domain